MSTTSPTSSAQSPPFRFPFGPSSKYHQREQQPSHARYKSAYIPTAPVLATERRASHRRSHTHKSSSSASSPPSEYTRSPLSRFSSYSPNMSAAPTTPAKFHRRGSSVQNSPFSDYFTDDARSVDSNVPSTATKQLLVRMNKLQSQLMRDSSSDAGRAAIKVVAMKLDEIERAFDVLHAPAFPVEDSGIFSDEEETDSKHAQTRARTVSEPYLDTVNGSMELPPEPSTIEEYKAERDWFISRTQELLDGLRYTQTELSNRFAEARQLNEEHNVQIEERDTQIEQLRSENEGLRSDLGFEYSELLFLKLQMKSLEVDVDSISEEFDASGSVVNKERHAKKNRILSEMDRWRSDWQDVKGRCRRRRSRYGVSPERHDSLSTDGEASPSTGETEWHLQTVKEGHGRVTSLTIKRMDSTYGTSVEETSGTADKADPLIINGSDSDSVKFASDAKRDQEADQNSEPEAQKPTQGPSEPQIATPSSSKYQYMEHGTQTEQYQQIPPLSQDEENDEDEEEEEDRLFSLEEEEEEEPAQNGAEDLGEDVAADEEEVEEEAGDEVEEEDCAITTSSEASDAEDESHFETPRIVESTKPTKTAWQELWESLQNLTGIDDRFED